MKVTAPALLVIVVLALSVVSCAWWQQHEAVIDKDTSVVCSGLENVLVVAPKVDALVSKVCSGVECAAAAELDGGPVLSIGSVVTCGTSEVGTLVSRAPKADGGAGKAK